MLKFLGRGSAFNVKEGNTSAYYITNTDYGNTLILLDCGESVFKEIVSRNILENIKFVNVFISHLNSDHIGSLSSLLFYLKYKSKINLIDIVCGYGIKDDIITLLNIQGNNLDDYNIYESSENDEDININIDEGCFRLIKVNHIKGMNCYGVVTKLNNNLIYYSGDSNEIPIEIMDNIEKIDYLYQDTCLADYEGNVHLSLIKLCELIPTEHRHKVWCMHLDCDELIEKAKSEGFNVVENI